VAKCLEGSGLGLPEVIEKQMEIYFLLDAVYRAVAQGGDGAKASQELFGKAMGKAKKSRTF
jgi:hypothetical protein